MTDHPRAKPLNAKTRESLGVALITLSEEFKYLQDAVKTTTNKTLLERLTTKAEHLKRSGEWLQSKLASVEEDSDEA